MKTIILGTAHLKSTPGKCSPDKKFFEYKYSREIVQEIYKELKNLGYNVVIDIPEEDQKLTSSQELVKRCSIVNSLCKKYGTSNCLYVSIHVNAAGADGKWHTATGWEVYSSIGKTKGDILAKCLNDSATTTLVGKKIRGIKEANFYILKHTNCPAALTENFFQDNKDDVEFLSSKEGKEQIIKLHIDGILKYINN